MRKQLLRVNPSWHKKFDEQLGFIQLLMILVFDENIFYQAFL